ncbi:MAG: ArsR/SmtB family transcription factor [Anaerolineae bacterium]
MSAKRKSLPPLALDDTTAERLAQLFSALGDPSRVRILWALSTGELSVGDLAERVSMSASAVSHQLRSLRLMRLVRARKAGREVFYAIDDDHVMDLFQRGLEHVRHS